MSKKPFKETGFGKFFWDLGDTFKGKTKTGKVLDSVLEILPVPNPIRIAKDVSNQSKLEKLARNPAVQQAAAEQGFNYSDLLDDGPKWLQPVLATAVLLGIIVLVGMGVIEPALLIEAIKIIFAGS